MRQLTRRWRAAGVLAAVGAVLAGNGSPVPEPASLALLLLGTALMAGRGRRRAKT